MTDNKGGLVGLNFPAVEVRANTHAATLWTNCCRQKFPNTCSLEVLKTEPNSFFCLFVFPLILANYYTGVISTAKKLSNFKQFT